MYKFYREREDDEQNRISRRRTIKDWWYDIEHIIRFSFEIKFYEILFDIDILNSLRFKTNITYPYSYSNSISIIDKILPWNNGCKLTKHKAINIDISHVLGIGISFYHSIHTDHAGFHLEIIFLIFSITISIFDDRHWNSDKNRWIEWDYENQRWIE
jgi:hypothetical protein